MTNRTIGRIVAGAPLILTMFSLPLCGPSALTASADGCPDAEVVFARGTGEPVGPGGPGQAFYDSLTSQLPGKNITLYPVDYPSTTDYANSAKLGADNEVAHVQGTIANCPKTKVVIGGYSQGAGVADLTSHRLPPADASHIAALALFGNPQSSYAKGLADNQIPALDPSYTSKAFDICLPNDNICAEGGSIIAHLGYVPVATNQAATFVAQKLQ
jgi:cutinase